MNNHSQISGCTCCPMKRRDFLTKGGAATIGALGLLSNSSWLHAASSHSTTRIQIIYSLHAEQQPEPDWPNKGFDFAPVMQKITATLRERCENIEFVTSLASNPEQAKQLLENDSSKTVDGYLVYQMNCWNKVIQTIAASGKPVLYADFQFGGSGGFLVYTAGFLRKNLNNVGFIASSNIDDLVDAVKCFTAIKNGGSPANFASMITTVRTSHTPRSSDLPCTPDKLTCVSAQECLRRLKEMKILTVRNQESASAGEIMGINVEQIPFAEVNEAWSSADKDESRHIADQWQKNARVVKDVSRETLETSAAMYLGMKTVLKNHRANAITMNCLGGFYGGHIHAYPCLGFHELNNQALIGACECDVRSTATMVAVTTLTQGRPGYISDPVIDTAKRQIIYAHCVASNRAFGPEGIVNPYEILTHSEDRQGASVRSLLPTGYMTTTLEFEQSKKEILFHQAKAVANDPDDRACRTKLCAEPVGDIEKLFTEWDRWGWHRVTFYGDLKEPVYALADALGWKVVEEA
ncbi:MAG: hypothetical protein V1799_15240 [bacterium]